MESDGDFRKNEIKKLRDEDDITITNPPFSMFREFLAWILEAKKQFEIIDLNPHCFTIVEQGLSKPSQQKLLAKKTLTLEFSSKTSWL